MSVYNEDGRRDLDKYNFNGTVNDDAWEGEIYCRGKMETKTRSIIRSCHVSFSYPCSWARHRQAAKYLMVKAYK